MVDGIFCLFFADANADPDADTTEIPPLPFTLLPAFSVDDFLFFDVASFLSTPPPVPVLPAFSVDDSLFFSVDDSLFFDVSVSTIPKAAMSPVAIEK